MKNYQTTNSNITISNNNYRIRSLKDRQQFYSHDDRSLFTGISSASWSYFGVVWPASHVLANTVSMINLDGLRILEIGCGIGLTSIVLNKLGADITASDYHPLAQAFLDKNMQLNELPPIKFHAGNWETENPLLGEFDLIIGSDVLYEPAHATDIPDFIDTHSSNSVKIIIVDPNRGNRTTFTRNMITLGYQHHYELFNVDGPASTNCKGRVLHYQRAQ